MNKTHIYDLLDYIPYLLVKSSTSRMFIWRKAANLLNWVTEIAVFVSLHAYSNGIKKKILIYFQQSMSAGVYYSPWIIYVVHRNMKPNNLHTLVQHENADKFFYVTILPQKK